ncbi:hypothetical protein ABT224_00200 [Streptomyces sp. NPDC001584]|uniref:hypothetical protein n=1 Tax=Streptomyces sp. NPDC001584 TaxID=3154521 RepID=UPI003332AD5B
MRLRRDPSTDAIHRPGDDAPAVRLTDKQRALICEVPDDGARGLALELADLLGLVVRDRGAVGEVAE